MPSQEESLKQQECQDQFHTHARTCLFFFVIFNFNFIFRMMLPIVE